MFNSRCGSLVWVCHPCSTALLASGVIVSLSGLWRVTLSLPICVLASYYFFVFSTWDFGRRESYSRDESVNPEHTHVHWGGNKGSTVYTRESFGQPTDYIQSAPEEYHSLCARVCASGSLSKHPSWYFTSVAWILWAGNGINRLVALSVRSRWQDIHFFTPEFYMSGKGSLTALVLSSFKTAIWSGARLNIAEIILKFWVWFIHFSK